MSLQGWQHITSLRLRWKLFIMAWWHCLFLPFRQNLSNNPNSLRINPWSWGWELHPLKWRYLPQNSLFPLWNGSLNHRQISYWFKIFIFSCWTICFFERYLVCATVKNVEKQLAWENYLKILVAVKTVLGKNVLIMSIGKPDSWVLIVSIIKNNRNYLILSPFNSYDFFNLLCIVLKSMDSSVELGMGFWVEVRFPTPLRL